MAAMVAPSRTNSLASTHYGMMSTTMNADPIRNYASFDTTSQADPGSPMKHGMGSGYASMMPPAMSASPMCSTNFPPTARAPSGTLPPDLPAPPHHTVNMGMSGSMAPPQHTINVGSLASSMRFPPQQTLKWGSATSQMGSQRFSSPVSDSFGRTQPTVTKKQSIISSEMRAERLQEGSLIGGKLRLRILQATNLRNMDLGVLPGDVSDPFVLAKLGKQEYKTDVIDNNLNPVWNSGVFEFNIENDQDKLNLQVLNSNNWHAHDNLGTMEVCLLNLIPGETHDIKDELKDGDGAKLEVEVKLISPQLAAGGDAGQYAGRANRQGTLAVRQPQKEPNWVPLPSFKGMGPEAFAPPPPKPDDAPIGERRKHAEYESLACRLGQYDYNAPAVYYPKQDEVDKRQWKDDPFYGWRNQLNQRENPRAYLKEDDSQSNSQALENEIWSKDPFHGWLKNSKDREGEGFCEKVQEAAAARRLISLPSFQNAPKRRYEDDYREYAEVHEVETRERFGTPQDSQVVNADRQWKDDAFFNWLPGRGPDSDNKHQLHRPLEQARLSRLPSFSENANFGIRGRGIGVLKVWINGAFNLSYVAASGLRGKPSACVKVKLGDKEEVTNTIAMEANPCWNTAAFVLEIESKVDALLLEVVDVAGNKSAPDQHQFFLGSYKLDARRIIEQYWANEKSRKGTEPVHVRQKLEGSEYGEIDFKLLFVPYDTERQVVKQKKGERDDPRAFRSLPRSASMTSACSGGGRSSSGAIGVLSVRIIAAYNLVNTDSGWFGDVSDPYVTMKLRSQSSKPKRTKTINNDLNPVWNSDPILFQIHNQNDELDLTVYDEDNKLSEDDFLGRMTIPLHNIIAQPGRPVRVRDALQAIQHGELEIEVGFSPE